MNNVYIFLLFFIIFSLIKKMQITSFMHTFEASGSVCLGCQLKSFFNERKKLKLKCLSKTLFKLKLSFQFHLEFVICGLLICKFAYWTMYVVNKAIVIVKICLFVSFTWIRDSKFDISITNNVVHLYISPRGRPL